MRDMADGGGDGIPHLVAAATSSGNDLGSDRRRHG